MAKDIFTQPLVEGIVKANELLVNFFSTSGFWHETLEAWCKENKVQHSIQTACETRWYSMATVCLSIVKPAQGFHFCIALQSNSDVDTSAIGANIRKLIEDRDHFTTNPILVKFLFSVVDAIGRLESANSTIGDIWKELTTTYFMTKKIDVYPHFEPFKEHCLNVIQKCSIT
ncbi:hypothetical protein O181_084553 [Austropuccinia psidii MF-1]|uniref:Uncharacterized protein n=1 Tax=Austropuccinia psidii MF-1 TaxID=1389203 RepID=A0A9Q3IKR7_9BASI|nr:hypothetical protein [Austropuccinia psidii MF-1]